MEKWLELATNTYLLYYSYFMHMCKLLELFFFKLAISTLIYVSTSKEACP